MEFWYQLLDTSGTILWWICRIVFFLFIISIIFFLCKKGFAWIKKLRVYIKKWFTKCKNRIKNGINSLTPNEKKSYKKDLIKMVIILWILIVLFWLKYIEDNYWLL